MQCVRYCSATDTRHYGYPKTAPPLQNLTIFSLYEYYMSYTRVQIFN